MLRVLLGLVLASVLIPSLTAQTVTVYSHRHYEADKKLYERFTAQTGIQVQVLPGDADQLIERIRGEGASSPADLLITADVGRLYRADQLGLFQALGDPRIAQLVPPSLRDANDHWTALTRRARILVWDKTVSATPPVSTYEQLAEASLAGGVVVRSSGNVYNISLVSALLAHWGPEKTLTWARGLAQNLAQAPQGGDRDQMKALAAGRGKVAVTNTYYLGQLLNSTNPAEREVGQKMGVIFPNQGDIGTHVNISGVGLLARSPNPEGARALVRFLLSDESQQVFAAENYEYPVRDSVPLAPVVASWGRFRADELPLARVGALSPEALSIVNQAGWK